MSQNKSHTLMTHGACGSKLRSVVRFIHASIPRKFAGNRACGRVLYYAWAARKFSAGIKVGTVQWNSPNCTVYFTETAPGHDNLIVICYNKTLLCNRKFIHLHPLKLHLRNVVIEYPAKTTPFIVKSQHMHNGKLISIWQTFLM